MLQFDYESILTELTTKLQTKLGGTITGGSTTSRLLEIISEKLAQVVRYTEYLTRETKWSLAQNASSILTQLELFGYDPHRKVGASGSIQVSASPSFNTTYPNTIRIPKFSEFSNGELTFCTTKYEELLNTAQYVSIPVIQGSLKTLEFRGSDINNYRFQIMNNSIENSLYELTQNGIVMTEVDAFGDTQLSYNGDDQADQGGGQYEYKLRNIQGFEGVEIQFPSGDEFTELDRFVFRYLVTEGVNGNVTETRSITTPLGQYTDTQGVSVRLYCRNEEPITGGSDYETVDEMRENAPLSFNRVDKYITKNDYLSAINSAFAGGANVFYIWTEQEANDQIPQDYSGYDFFNNSKIFICGASYSDNRELTPWNNSDQLSILNSNQDIISHKGLTDYFVMENPAIDYFYITGTVFFKRSLTDATLARSAVSSRIIEEYQPSKLTFFNSIYHSDYISLFRDMEEIDHVDIELNLYCLLEMTQEPDDSGKLSEGVITAELRNFGFSNSDNNRYYITLYDSESDLFIEDLVYAELKDGTYQWFDISDIQQNNPLTQEGENYLGWQGTAQTPALGLFGALTIKGSYLDKLNAYNEANKVEQEIDGVTYITYPAQLIVRFKPYNGDSVLLSQNQINALTYSSDISNLWKSPEDDPTRYSNDPEYTLVFSEVAE